MSGTKYYLLSFRMFMLTADLTNTIYYQLPPTVRSDTSALGTSPLSTSLMARLSSISELHPVTVTAQKDKTPIETKFIECKPTRQAVSSVIDRGNNSVSYRKQFSGSVLLSMQFRMHPSIAAFSSAIFYDGLLGSPLTLSKQRPFPSRLNNYYSVSNEYKGEMKESGDVIPVASPLDPSNSSYRNEEEASEVLELLKILLRQEKVDPFQGSIGIVTPYSSQVALIKSLIAKDDQVRELAQSFANEIEVKSVE
jgi:superfamily I DNA and/or RNA helicase